MLDYFCLVNAFLHLYVWECWICYIFWWMITLRSILCKKQTVFFVHYKRPWDKFICLYLLLGAIWTTQYTVEKPLVASLSNNAFRKEAFYKIPSVGHGLVASKVNRRVSFIPYAKASDAASALTSNGEHQSIVSSMDWLEKYCKKDSQLLANCNLEILYLVSGEDL